MKIIDNCGLAISEYIVGTHPKQYYFPIRNRIVSAISRKVLVVEGAVKSGSLITANLALDYGKEVFASNQIIINSDGTKNLIFDGANTFKETLDLLKEY